MRSASLTLVTEPGVMFYPQAIEEMMPSLIARARAVAWRSFQRAPHALDREELESIAFEGLCQARVAWPAYCERNGYSPQATQYFQAYAGRRMHGAVLDHLRASDWVTRSTRQRVKALQEAGSDLGRSHAELAIATGLSTAQIRAAEAGVSRKPVSLDDGDRDVPQLEDVEQQATVAQVLAAISAAGRELPLEARLVLALRYYEGRDFPEIAGISGLSLAEVDRLHAGAVAAVHQAMLRAVV